MGGSYRIETEQIRSLAVTCHTLDTGFDRLFNSETICKKSRALTRSYEGLFASNLLNLAVSIRVALSRNPEYRSVSGSISACGLFDVGAPHNDGNFSVKDVCDKIIHADDIFKLTELGVRGAGCRLRGTHRGKPWEFGLGVSIFCEHALAWLERIESESGPERPAAKGGV